ncbi:hypothetical protein GlitD10_2504 [Gloeomargarita lithophora Alchichica-D10]|uniref:DUF2281 domain-containing protein n=1 Tax=Gloeomargarita lithophora Alchichica-D10 TaxID=1188229 RepID=A0A1J0AFX5_9CYAN|nr:DUF2281 domain-containing protein [Gloeomargarita lithophora]APB34841.1 hypothetical protein GlitD10_2504 [Gloeomargarita lithophora Alchichica-D10]
MTSTAPLEQAILAHLRQLPPEKQQEVLDFAEFLHQKTTTRSPRRSLKGLCADLNIEVTETDITAARQEMWSGFPREMPD